LRGTSQLADWRIIEAHLTEWLAWKEPSRVISRRARESS
jgi:hypothetical protein